MRQRPDILVAEANLHQASAGIGVATAALLPSVSLNAGYGVNDAFRERPVCEECKLLEHWRQRDGAAFRGRYAVVPPQGGDAGFEQAAASYRQTVLSAFAQVADTLRALEHDAASLEAQNRAVDAATGRFISSNRIIRLDIAGYTSVLIADAQFYQAKISDLEARAQRYQDTVALFVALGGGWWNTDAGLANR